MNSNCTLLSDVSERSEESFNCSTRQSTTSDTDTPFQGPCSIPCINMEPIDETPFSESFSGIFDHGDLFTTSFRLNNDMSYNLDLITDIQEVDSDWDDEDIDEIVVISRKGNATKLSNKSSPANIVDARNRKQLLEKVFSLSDFDFIDHEVDLRETLSGTHAVRKRDTNCVYIMKAFRATPSFKWPFELRLLEMLTEQDCSFLPCILRRIFEHQSLFILLDSYPAGNMLNYVLQEGALDPDEVLFYSSEIASLMFVEGISVLHDAKIEHRNINPANVMIGGDGHLVLTGFENSRVNGNDSSNVDPNQRILRDCEYRAPEVLLRWDHDNLVDCWGLGCLMYYMTYGKHPFPLIGFNQALVYKKVLRGGTSTVHNDGRMEPAALNLILRCLERNPRLRPNIELIKQHEYFNTINWFIIQQKGTSGLFIHCFRVFFIHLLSIAPYIPSSPNPGETSWQDLSGMRRQSPSEESKADTAVTAMIQTPNNCDPLKSTSSKARSVYSLQARHSVQDLLPTIFRSPSLDDLKMTANHSRLIQDHSILTLKSTFASIPDRVPSYESLQRSPIVKRLGREERLSLFWDTLDKDVNAAAPKQARVLGIAQSSSES
ncbi:kinase-like domain-containing protein, partial [Lentinula aciculospora]